MTFTFIDPYACCVTEYHDKSVTVADDCIIIRYSFDNTACALAYCALPPYWASATLHSAPAGEYSIYAAASPYCTEEPCPDYVLEPRYIGEITIDDPPIINSALIVIPPEPTTEDSITVKVLDPYGCCLTEYHDISVTSTPNDSGLLFSYNYDTTGCSLVNCIIGANWLSGATGPKAAGEYCVFRAAMDVNDVNINGIDASPAPTKLGCFTVTDATPVKEKGIRSTLFNGHATPAKIRVFNTAGRVIRTISLQGNGPLKAKFDRAMAGLPRGTYVIENIYANYGAGPIYIIK